MLEYIELHLTIRQADKYLEYLTRRHAEDFFENLKLIAWLRHKIDNARVEAASHIHEELDRIETE